MHIFVSPAGVAHTLFVGANDKPRAGELINVLREAKQAVPEDLLKFGTAGGRGHKVPSIRSQASISSA